jgi:cell division protein FtsQ
MKRSSALMLAAIIAMLFYLAVALLWSHARSKAQICAGLENDCVEVIDRDGVGFVTSEEATRELGDLAERITTMRIADINLDSICRRFNSLDKIEHASVNRLANNKVRIRLWPMKPVARVWSPNGHSYYINRDGKQITADARYHIDVPQVAGRFDSTFTAVQLLPLLDYLDGHPEWNALVSMLSVRNSQNIMIIPVIRGHVINLGDVSDIPDKFHRLKRFYSEVMPVKGWEFYDTISVKWDGQVVATRRNGKLPDLSVPIIDELENEADDIGTMTTDSPADTLKQSEI